MPQLYALNMMADLSDDSAGQFQPFGTNSRQWYVSSNNGGSWSLLGTQSSDDIHPTLNYADSSPATADSVQFAVFYTGAQPCDIQSATISITFGSGAVGNRSIASPFRQPGGNVRTILGDDGVHPFSDGNGNNAFFIGQYQVGVNRIRSGLGLLSFEFTLAARFVLKNGNGQILEYGYDPEMDVEISS